MSMGFSQSLSLGQSQTPRQELNQAQRQSLVQGHLLQLRLELIEQVRGEKYRPQATCPKCNHSLTPLEIIRGFNRDPYDFTTSCTKCHHRFAPKLVHHGRLARTELPFYCDAQTQARLRGWETLSPDDLKQIEPALYHSAVVHRGTLKAAFAALDIVYDFAEIVEPLRKVEPFLGHLPDRMIAEIIGLKARAVGARRRELGIPACTHRKVLAEAMTTR